VLSSSTKSKLNDFRVRFDSLVTVILFSPVSTSSREFWKPRLTSPASVGRDLTATVIPVDIFNILKPFENMSGVPDLISGPPGSQAVGVSHTQIKPKATAEQIAQSQSRTAAIREAFREMGAVNGNPLSSNEILRLLNQKL
jgi:hypothetical protein